MFQIGPSIKKKRDRRKVLQNKTYYVNIPILKKYIYLNYV